MSDLSWLGDLLLARDEEGRRRFGEREAQDLLAAVLLSGGTPDDLTPSLERLMAGFADRAGVEPEATTAEAEAQVAAYFAANPLPAALCSEFRLRYRDDLVTEDRSVLAAAAERIEGGLARVKAPPADGPKGPLAYFAAQAGTVPDGDG